MPRTDLSELNIYMKENSYNIKYQNVPTICEGENKDYGSVKRSNERKKLLKHFAINLVLLWVAMKMLKGTLNLQKGSNADYFLVSTSFNQELITYLKDVNSL